MPRLYHGYEDYEERMHGNKVVALINRARQIGCSCLMMS
jgi:hypothetical protein